MKGRKDGGFEVAAGKWNATYRVQPDGRAVKEVGRIIRRRFREEMCERVGYGIDGMNE